MISFYYNLVMLVRTVVGGFRNDPEFRVIAVLLIFLLIGGAVFFIMFKDGHYSTLYISAS